MLNPSFQSVDVVLPLALPSPLTYTIESTSVSGTIVKVPFRNKSDFGLLLKENKNPPQHIELKKAKETQFILSSPFLNFLEKTAEYTLAPLGMLWKMVKGGVDLDKVDLATVENQNFIFNLATLNESQETATQAILKSIKTYQTFLLHGVTGSGKTEVYFHLIEKTLKMGKQVLVMLPEIGLTQQWLSRFQERFGASPLIWHSLQSTKKRRNAWALSYSEKPCVIIGTRSSLFLPFKNLGLIIVDEEHDPSYKQEEQVLYHARDMAILRGFYEKCPVVLCSATPSLESLYNVQEGKSIYLKLESRYGNALMPTLKTIDMKSERTQKFVSTPLLQEIQKRLLKKEQSLLFLNRRGFAPLYLCKTCGEAIMCPGCSITLYMHKSKKKGNFLSCHHCGFERQLHEKCPSCDNLSMIPYGPGVDRIAEEIQKFFPNASIAALTSDVTQEDSKALWEKIFQQEIDIIVGTQLLAKGHHIPNLTLVGILDGDMGLRGADWRANEKAFQLLQQVSGRAGREEKVGEVFIQTFQPDHFLFNTLQQENQEDFLINELNIRETIGLPPYKRLASITLSGIDAIKTEKEAKTLATFLRTNAHKSLEVLGPIEAPLFKLQSRFRYQILLKAPKLFHLSQFIENYIRQIKISSSVRVLIDIDPI